MSRNQTTPCLGTVLVTDADRGSALTIIRSLGRKGWRVIAADSNHRSLGFHSRYAAGRLIYPPPRSEPAALVERLLEAVRELDVDLLIPVTDEIIHPLSHARDRFEGLCRLAIGSTSALDVVTDKAKTLALAQRLGVPVPETRVVHTIPDALEAASVLGWPVVVKPAVSRRYDRERDVIETGAVSYANSEEELVYRVAPHLGGGGILLQAYSEGSGHGVELLAWKGRPVAAFQHKRLAEIPATGGTSAWRESVPLDGVLYRHAARLVRALRWSGLIMVEFKVGEKPRLMEINGRVWGSLPLAVHAGMDFPARLADLYISKPTVPLVRPDTSYTVGVRGFNLELILQWIPQVLLGKRRYRYLPLPPRLRALAAVFGLLSPRQKLDVTSVDDPWPGVAEIGKIVRKLRVKLRQEKPKGPDERNDVQNDPRTHPV